MWCIVTWIALLHNLLLTNIMTYNKLIETTEANTAQLLSLSVTIERNNKLLSQCYNHLTIFLDEFEGAFASDEGQFSIEILESYEAAAMFAQENFGRTNNIIIEVREQIFKQITGL